MSRARLPLAVLLAAAAVSAQQAPQPPTFRSRADLVQVDVVVVDKAGRPVRGLKASDFTLLDRRKPQTIAAFEEIAHERDRSGAPALSALPAAVKRDVASNQTAQANRLIVLVVDDLHIYRGRTDRAKAIASAVVNDLGPEASMAVLFTSGEHSTQVTEDRSRLFAAVETLKGRKAWRRPHQAVDTQRAGRIDPEMSSEAALSVLAKAQGTNLQEFFENLTQYHTLRDAARLLGGSDGRRKAFVFISEGIARDLAGIFGALAPRGDIPAGGGSYATGGGAEALSAAFGPAYHEIALVQMMESMRRSNVATYAIDPRGRVSSQQLALEMFPSTGWAEPPVNAADPGFRWNNPVRQAQDGLQIMAQASGGFAVTDTDDFTSGIRKIVQDLDHYYLLGFYPSDTKGKRYRPLDVKIAGHPEWTLRFRHGYQPGDPPAPPKVVSPLVSLSAGLLPRGDLPLRLMAIPMPGTDRTARVALALEVTVPSLRLREADARLRDELSYEILAVNEKRSKVTSLSGRSGRLTLSPVVRDGSAPDTLSYQIGEAVDLPPGRFQLHVSAISAKLGTGGSVYLDIDVPDFAAAPLSLSGLAIGYAGGSRLPVAPVPPGRAQALPFSPTLDREFVPSDTLRLHLSAGTNRSAAPLRTLVELLDAQNRSVASYEPAGVRTIDLEIPLKALGPGAYILRATVADVAHSASREIGFVVR